MSGGSVLLPIYFISMENRFEHRSSSSDGLFQIVLRCLLRVGDNRVKNLSGLAEIDATEGKERVDSLNTRIGAMSAEDSKAITTKFKIRNNKVCALAACDESCWGCKDSVTKILDSIRYRKTD